MGERWRETVPEGPTNGVDHRVRSEAIEREWLTGLFSSVGKEPADADALLRRMRERRTSDLRKGTRVTSDGGRGGS